MASPSGSNNLSSDLILERGAIVNRPPSSPRRQRRTGMMISAPASPSPHCCVPPSHQPTIPFFSLREIVLPRPKTRGEGGRECNCNPRDGRPAGRHRQTGARHGESHVPKSIGCVEAGRPAAPGPMRRNATRWIPDLPRGWGCRPDTEQCKMHANDLGVRPSCPIRSG